MKIKNYQREKICELFSPSSGYVLDFSNKTFAEFFEDHFETNIYAEVFSEKGTSKLNRLLCFIEVCPSHVVVELLNLLWKRRNKERDSEIEQAVMQSSLESFSITPEYVEILLDNAAVEDKPFQELIDEIGTAPVQMVQPHFSKLTKEWTLDTVEREFQRAFDSVEKDPEASVTAACSMLEGVCKSIIATREIERPKRMDIKSLYLSVREPLGLAPDKSISQSEIEGDVRAILSALSNLAQGIGSLRTHAGTAHGRERGVFGDSILGLLGHQFLLRRL
ncbi:hypothetical protein FIU97_04280 [Roseivivax sp. THAF40]|uniref:abortive infection family protein n=1 Tax=Roseivivax sp. THAF40 TaxID=2587858 RepID=UPI001267934D|nr:abortive infection family protein [Roseivivax sp. THAF40]QFT45786.1 hypothetical protein FIU97_04280 [Roseivivax sp. THAF40]